MERPWGRTLRAVALLVFCATAFVPLHACRARPPTARRDAIPPSGRTYVPARVVAEAAHAAGPRGPLEFLWTVRNVYPYLLAPAWAALLLLAELGGRRGRAAAGVLAVALAAGVAAFEYRYIRADYTGVLPASVRGPEQVAAWAVVVVVLFARRRGRRLLDPEAAVSAQALLAFLHAWTFPAADLRRHLASGHALGPVLDVLAANYQPGFLVAAASLLAVAAPAYLRVVPSPDGVPVARATAPPAGAAAPGPDVR
ncbi:MAG: hypothetical protein U1E39_01370 [Planctomycetota bacterium]